MDGVDEVAALGDHHTVPVEAVAYLDNLHVVDGTQDGEMQREGGVAVADSADGMCGLGGGGVGGAVPGVAGASGIIDVFRKGAYDGVIHHEQRAVAKGGADAARAGSAGVDGLVADGVLLTHADGVAAEAGGSGGMRHDDIVDPRTVAAGADAAVLGIGEAEDVGTCRNRVGGTRPGHFARSVELLGAVDVEVELIVVGFRRYLIVETDAVGRSGGDADGHLRRQVGTHGVGRTAAVVALVGARIIDEPLHGAVAPSAEVRLVVLEGLTVAVADEHGQRVGKGSRAGIDIEIQRYIDALGQLRVAMQGDHSADAVAGGKGA